MSRRRPPAPVAFPPLRLVYDRDRADNGQQQQEQESAAAASAGACPETVALLTELLRLARQGRVNGLALAVLYDDNSYRPKVVGDARLNPTFARGMVRALDDLLADHVRGLC